jgi:ribosomal protein S18 acetylase RimI-like enzyme
MRLNVTNNLKNIEIRQYHHSDLTSLYKICLLTANSGKDASDLYKNHDLVGHLSAAPYAIFEPELTFIVTLNNEPSGYILGTKNSMAFYQKCETDWFPILRKRYPFPHDDDSSHDAKIIRRIHNGYVVKEELLNYPAHLHIDLLPDLQGMGLGRKIMNTFIEKLNSLDIPALHLEVGKSNLGAIEFYKRMGFHELKEYQYSIAFGINLTSEKI